ncbi:flagellar basal body L-ring protein FlgH [Massilia sp. W12]|uniref:flagellar basal body L-ring protein FlgH n=1 Tax=Massilia sp. W12 TaxID=3126507 RepID=UPI0030D1A7B1
MKLLHYQALGLAVLLAGCAATPTSIISTPRTARPVSPEPVQALSGAIFQGTAYRPMFEDRRARMVGDSITITISESTSAIKSASSSGSKSGSAAVSVPTVTGFPLKTMQGARLTATTANKFEDKDTENASNTFTGTISATVIDVLPNGNLVVAGEKQLALDKGTEFIRVSGVISPDNIQPGNTIASSKVADARVEYRTNTQIDRASFTSMISRLFMSVLPF